MKNPKVSLIIPVYNKQKKNDYLKEAIESALSQDYENLEIIVVNDGSNDKNVSRNIALSYGKKIVYVEKENGGVSTALNLAIEKMTGDYFSWLSHDDIYYNNKISDQIRYLKENKLFDTNTILYSNYEVIDKNSKHIGFSIKNHNELKEKPEYALLRGAINGLTLLIPKKAFEECGGFDPKLKAIQDYELWYRFMKKYKFVHIEQVLVKSRYHATQVSNTSPLVLSEGNPFFIKVIEGLSDERKKELEKSVYNFYVEMIKFFKNTPYSEVVEYCKKKKIEEFEKVKKQTKNVDVDVIIPFYNRIDVTINAIKSVLTQTHKNYKIILINDGSNENISKIKMFIKKYNQIHLMDLKENIGAAAARNKGIDFSKAKYIAFLDSDDQWLPEKLEKQLIIMEATQGDFSHTSYSRILEGKKTIINSGESAGYKNPNLIYACPIATPTVMLRLEFLNKNKFRFNPALIIGEDTCFWLEMLKKTELYGIEEPLTIVNAGKTSAAYNLEKQILGFKTIIKYLLNDEYYMAFNLEIALLMDPYVNLIKQYYNLNTNREKNFFKRNFKRIFFSIKNVGLIKTIKKVFIKVKRKLFDN